MQSNWWQELERDLEQQFDSFLKNHPGQRELLEQEEHRAQQQRRQSRLQEIEAKAQALRSELLVLSEDIRAWRGRVERAQGANATDLASRAEVHLGSLMGQGREKWQSLSVLGEENRQLKEAIAKAEQESPKPPPSPPEAGHADLEEAWKCFEAQQELERLRREKG